MKKTIKVISLFDGISVAQQALTELGYTPLYYASEIDKYAIEVTQRNHPKTIQVGDVKNLIGLSTTYNGKFIFKNIDLLIGGSPCQDLSIAKANRQGLKGYRSSLFYEYLRILKEVKPKYFVLENVASMSNSDRDTISKELGVEPIMIDASLVSAQTRKRYFWTNIPNVKLPDDRGIILTNILEEKTKDDFIVGNLYNQRVFTDKAGTIGTTMGRTAKQGIGIYRLGHFNKGGQGDRIYSIKGKSVTLSANGGGRGAKTGLYLTKDNFVRKLTPIECERLQSLPDNYTTGFSDTQRYKMCGNAFNKEVIKHILSYAKF